MSARPTVIFYENNDHRFYGAGMMLLWTLQHLQRIHPVFVSPGQGELSQRVREAGIETVALPVSGAWQRVRDSKGPGSKLHRGLAAFTLGGHVLALARLIRQRQAIGVHANSTRAALLAGPAARIAGVPMWWHLRRQRPMQGPERLAYALCDRVICVAREVQRALGDPPKATVITDGIPADRLDYGASGAALRARLGWPADSLVVGDVASISPRKRHDLFIRMALALAESFPQARFFIAGHSPQGASPRYEAELRALAQPLIDAGRFAFLGWVEEMSPVFAAMDIFVLPSDNEGLGLVAIEAMQMGVPVVRTHTAGAQDMIRHGETGYIIPTDDLPALVSTVRTLLEDAALRRRIGRAGRDFARAQFSARRMTDRLEALMLGLSSGLSQQDS